MAVHKRIRKAGRKLLAHVRERGRALQRRRANRGDAGDPQGAASVDQRFSTLAAHVLEGRYYECPWQLFRLGHFKGLEDEPAVREVVAWARRQEINVMFEVRKVRDLDVVYLLLRAKS